MNFRDQFSVYFIKPVWHSGPIKIGLSEHPQRRLDEFRTWSPVALELIGSVAGNWADEQFLHECLAEHHSHGEWFHAASLVLSAIERVISAGTVEVVRGDLKPVVNLRAKKNRATRSKASTHSIPSDGPPMDVKVTTSAASPPASSPEVVTTLSNSPGVALSELTVGFLSANAAEAPATGPCVTGGESAAAVSEIPTGRDRQMVVASLSSPRGEVAAIDPGPCGFDFELDATISALEAGWLSAKNARTFRSVAANSIPPASSSSA